MIVLWGFPAVSDRDGQATPLLERITARRTELTEQAERLRLRLAEVEGEAERLGVAEQVVK